MRKELVNYAFIDGQNFYKSIQGLENELEALEVNLDLKEFRVYLSEKYAVNIAYYFVGNVRKYENLYAQLKGQGYKLIFKERNL